MEISTQIEKPRVPKEPSKTARVPKEPSKIDKLISEIEQEKQLLRELWKDAKTFFRKTDKKHPRKEQQLIIESMDVILKND